MFKKLVLAELERLPVKVYESQDIKKGIESLEASKDIVNHPVDKGGGVLFYQKSSTNTPKN